MHPRAWIGIAVGLTILVATTTGAAASPLIPAGRAVMGQETDGPVLIRHKPWHKMKGYDGDRGHHYGWYRGKHKGWYKHR